MSNLVEAGWILQPRMPISHRRLEARDGVLIHRADAGEADKPRLLRDRLGEPLVRLGIAATRWWCLRCGAKQTARAMPHSSMQPQQALDAALGAHVIGKNMCVIGEDLHEKAYLRRPGWTLRGSFV
jgi:hypothetical protein